MRKQNDRLIARVFAAVLAAIWIYLLVPSAFSAPHPSVCRVVNSLGNQKSLGSGTLIDRTKDGKEGLVLTCQHLFSEGLGEILVEFPNGDQHRATFLQADSNADLAALSLGNPRGQAVRINLGEIPNGDLFCCGYGGQGKYRCSRGKITGKYPDRGIYLTSVAGAARMGDSGGALFDNQGGFVGVIVATDNESAYSSTGEPLRKFLAKVTKGKLFTETQYCRPDGRQYRSGDTCSPGQQHPQQAPRERYIQSPPVVYADPNPLPKENDTQWAGIRDRLDALEARPSPEKGDTGPVGPQGIAGEDGQHGTDATFDDRVLALYARQSDLADIADQSMGRHESLLGRLKGLAVSGVKEKAATTAVGLTAMKLAGIAGLGGASLGGPIGLGIWLARRRIKKRLRGGGDPPFPGTRIIEMIQPPAQVVQAQPLQMAYQQQPAIIQQPVPREIEAIEWKPRTTTVTETTEQIAHRTKQQVA